MKEEHEAAGEAADDHTATATTSALHELLYSLVESCSHVQFLKPKWSLLSPKFSTLLHSLPSHDSHSSNPLLSDLLRSISATCSSAASLALACRSSIPPAGKLQTQNFLHSISANLDAHINDLHVLLLHSDSDSTTATRATKTESESIQAEARNLITRLQIGSNHSKSSVLDSLLGLLQVQEDHHNNVSVALRLGIVPVLVNLLDSTSSSEIKEKTVTALAKISTLDSTHHVFSAQGLPLLNNLLRVLESGSIFAKEKSCITLRLLTNSRENARTIVSRGGISSLLEICQQGTPNSQALAAGVLRNLAVFEETKESMIEENAVSILLGLCNSGTILAQENAFGCLNNLLYGNDDLKLIVAREGGIECLTNFWDSAPSVQTLEVVVRMVGLLSSCPNIAEYLVANAFLDRIVGVLNCGVLGVRIAAAKALCNLAYSTKIRKELGETGCIHLLVVMLDGKAVEECETAAKALSVLLNYVGNRKLLKKEEKGIISVVQLLDPSVKNLNKEYPLTILGLLADSKKCRKQMVAAGAQVHLQKLVESNVEGAKRILNVLEGGGLWGVFGKH